ncbi:hypothetical protein PSI9734_00785 [Pseudidiomarina piscicola]|uniref:Uncharacterized protein n=1 Tax=Pseudidiomarina piscicola TaxID=2614830 RepID=A0A6S6WM15_9GAMM|nr:hypothetical protein [Pseudidiomarina piscicola]CAB0150227.1 hypothetical protein PSI9734_00785 [Pseudidiomarina piscicola]VZT39659.1 hypothetical protein PSI9734_00785 [Pseudomonas aeruginosa]
MIYAIIVIVIGVAVFFSGIWEQNLSTIILGALLEGGGWLGFYIAWRAAKNKGK